MPKFIARFGTRISVRLGSIFIGLVFLPALVVAQPSQADKQTTPNFASPRKQPLVHTYSIVARDPDTGQMGVAVQSNWFSAGSLVSWAEAGVGAIATQSMVEQSYGPLGLQLMRAGKSAPDALKSLLASDAQASVRQVAMIDAQGRVAAHTGELLERLRDQEYVTGYLNAVLEENDGAAFQLARRSLLQGRVRWFQPRFGCRALSERV
jgi:hypothetical protein